MPIDPPNDAQGQRIDSWKEIAAFFGRDERTVKRWESQRGLPVHRVPGGARGTVYAFTGELTAWLRSAAQQREAEGARAAASAENAAANAVKKAADQGEADKGEADKGDKEDAESVLEAWHRVEIRRTQAPPPLPAPPPAVPQRAWRWVLALALVAFAISVAAFPHFFEIRSVHGRLMPEIARRVESAKRQQAQELYLQGRFYWTKRTPDGLTQALDDFTKATQLDPNYALAYAGEADCYNLLREFTSMPASQAFPLAISAAKKSLELDDQLPEGHRALAFSYFWWNWDLAGAEREFRRAIALNPNDVEAHHWYATALMALSRNPEALAEIERARQLDPASSSIAADRGEILFNSGRPDDAIATLLELEKSEPEFLSPYIYLSRAYFDRKEYEKSFAQGAIAARISHDQKSLDAIVAAKRDFASGGEQEMLNNMLSDQLDGFNQGTTLAWQVAKTYALVGKNQEALEYLQKSYQRHEYDLISMINWEGFAALRPNPEFQELVHRIGLPVTSR
jgi:tetratricopeptide (TPR) repeat protein